MNLLRQTLLLAAASLWFAAPNAFAATETRTFTVGVNLLDLQNPPATFTETIANSVITSLIKVEVGLHLVGDAGFASEMFVSLIKSPTGSSPSSTDPISILLNRVGVTDSNPAGFGYDGWDVIFSDNGIGGDIHVFDPASAFGVLSGIYEPDGRILPTDPDTARPSLLDEFTGLPGNGTWRLNVGDLAVGGTMRLESWSLSFSDELTAVPEPGAYLAGAFVLLILVVTGLKRNQHAT